MASECNENRDIVAVSVDEETPPAGVSMDISAGQSRRRELYRVPRQLRDNKKHIYEPIVVPLGPYHHGLEPEFEVAEQLKHELRDILCSDKGFLLRKISERIDQVKHFYGGGNSYGDEELAEMMLRDACFLLSYMERGENYRLICRRLGRSGAVFVPGDLYMLENQIPLWLINMLISSIYGGAEQSHSFLCDFLSSTVFRDLRMTELPWGDGEEEPLHLLEALHRTILRFHLVKKSNILRLISKYSQPRMKSSSTMRNRLMVNSPFRSVTDLKAKGIYCKRSSPCLTDIHFFSFAFCGQLHLPFFYITTKTIILYSNLIAFEMSPETEAHFCVTAYINFMKTLIDTAKDVKVLRESGIFHSALTNDEEVVRMFKSIDTYGFRTDDTFHDLKTKIDEHCKNKAKTWIAELINTKFRSPWTIIALLAAAFLLCLTFLQTYYTISPRT